VTGRAGVPRRYRSRRAHRVSSRVPSSVGADDNLIKRATFSERGFASLPLTLKRPRLLLLLRSSPRLHDRMIEV
jgi:hypothetical protein